MQKVDFTIGFLETRKRMKAKGKVIHYANGPSLEDINNIVDIPKC